MTLERRERSETEKVIFSPSQEDALTISFPLSPGNAGGLVHATPHRSSQTIYTGIISYYDLSDLRSSRYSFQSPIRLEIQMYQGWYLVSDEMVCIHGLGPTIPDALDDYEDSLLNYFKSLKGRKGRLSPALQEDLDKLEKVITKRRL